jgi:hypothetical protein
MQQPFAPPPSKIDAQSCYFVAEKVLNGKPGIFKQLARGSGNFELAISPTLEESAMEADAQPDESVGGDAYHKINENTAIHSKSLVTQNFGQMRCERKIINRVPYQNRDQVFQPANRSYAEKLSGPCHYDRSPADLAGFFLNQSECYSLNIGQPQHRCKCALVVLRCMPTVTRNSSLSGRARF